MLIVNADDWGRTRAETDAALTCFLAGRVTSVTAMMFMADSERAADIALKHDIPVGLHLNLTEALTAGSIDAEVVSDQRKLATRLSGTRYSIVVPMPSLRHGLARAFNRQLEEFIRLYGRTPTHFDGHRHFHLCSSMLFAAPIPKGARVRRTFSFTPHEHGLANWLYRRAIDRWVTRRYRTTDYFFALSQRMAASRLAEVTRLALGARVELMTHPVVANERSTLLHRDFERALAGVALRSYADL
jgi:predicted glycoside hydrolase/deacetylase ChbG (UPF0249 family)